MLRVSRSVAAAASACLLSIPAPGNAASARSVEAEFRGCDAAGWCKFRIEAAREDPLYRVRANGVARAPAGAPVSIAVRNRLNALLSSMIHQNKQIVLEDLRALDDGTFAATITVNGQNVASDPMLVELGESRN